MHELTPSIGSLQTSDTAEVEGIKAGVAVLKRVCRQRTTVAWKDWRHSVEEQKRVALQVCPLFSFLCGILPARKVLQLD